MTTFFHRFCIATVFTVSTSLAAISTGQVQSPQQTQRGQGNMTDAQLAAMLLIDNQNEVATARLAEQRTKDAEVKKFARKMIEDHSKFIEKLRPLAGQYASIAANDVGSGRATTAQRNRGESLDIVQLKQQLGQKCLESTHKELKSKEGTKFDHCYVGMQVGEHMKMVDTLSVFQEYASPDFKALLKEGEETAEEHLKHAKMMAEKMMDGHAGSTTSREHQADHAKDNTAINERDRSKSVKTPIDQNENQKDINVTAGIRKRVVDTKMSVNAKNVKIITQDGKVTLRGPVKSDEEKKQIEKIAADVAGAGNVDSQLEIQP
jgi:hyperosmotically inducible periplasmic protein